MQHLWKSFYCSMWGALTVRLLGKGYGSYFPTKFTSLPYSSIEMIPYIFLSTICGFLGVWFVMGLEKMGQLRKKYKILSLSKYYQILIIGCITSALSFYFVHLRMDYSSIMSDFFSPENLKFPSNSYLTIPFIFLEFSLKFFFTSKKNSYFCNIILKCCK